MRLFFGFLVLLGTGCGSGVDPVEVAPESIPQVIGTYPDFRLIEKHPHPQDSFTQGLEFLGARLFESTGRRGKSNIRELDPVRGKVLRESALPDEFFGEGLTYHNGHYYQLTWTSGKAFKWTVEPFERVQEFSYEGEGWGLASDGTNLWMSNGSARLQQVHPETFEALRQVEVVLDGEPVNRLNELEWVDGLLLANIWGSNKVVAIDPDSGTVLKVWDLSPLWHQLPMGATVDVLNGLAWHKERRRLWVTGKLWPLMFEIELDEFPSLLPGS